MKVAILSDIHGNLPALQAVLDDIKEQKITSIFVLGDQLGYYYQAAEVYKLLIQKKAIMITGNHEQIFIDFLNGKNCELVTKKYGGSYGYYKKSFTNELIKYIKKLPIRKLEKIEGLTILLSHSNPKILDGYLYPDVSLMELQKLENSKYNYIFLGHTHYPMIYNGKATTIINPGSVGQSRIKGGIADWGILNTSNNIYTAQKTNYDINKTIENLTLHSEEKDYLFKILKR